MTAKIIRAYSFSSLEPVMFSSEYSSFDNPDGAIYGYMYRVVAEADNGSRYIHQLLFESENDANKLAQRVNNKLVIDLSYWNETYSCYGSDAWHKDEIFRQVSLSEAVANNDLEKIEEFS
jgi:hypothetical protein